MSVALAFDALVSLLLVAVIGYAVVLRRKLAEFQAYGDTLRSLVDALGEASDKAEAGGARLRVAAEEGQRTLGAAIENSTGLRDDLRYLVDRAEAACARLENGIGAARIADTISAEVGAGSIREPAPAPEPRGLSEALEALR